jgi:serine/threonine protein kinase
VLKFFEGESLTSILKQVGTLKENEAKDVLQSICLALKYCHEIGIAHRDVKTENILIGGQCELEDQLSGEKFQIPDQSSEFLKGKQIMLIDFAFATSCLGGKKVDTYCGTQSYMSPEILRKEAHCPKKADVWALGILAYKLLTGEHPFQVVSPSPTSGSPEQAAVADSLEERVLKEDFRREKIQGVFSRSVNNFLDRCLDKCPDKRSSVKELLQDSWIKASYSHSAG